MPVVAKLRHLRIAPRKVRLVSDLIRGKTVEEAQTILNFAVKKTAQPLLKLLKSAIANAKNNFQIEEQNLYVAKILVDEGQKYKRWMPRARGMAYEIQKKTSHITLVLDEIVKKPKETRRVEETKKVAEAPKVEKKIEKPKFKPEIATPKPKMEKGAKRIFQRKVF